MDDTQRRAAVRDRWAWIADTFLAPDFVLGVVSMLGVWIAVAASGTLQSSEVPSRIMYGYVALGVAVLGVCLTSVSILVGGLGDHYLQILDQAGGIRAALQPMKTISIVGALTTSAAIVGLLVWELGPTPRPGAFAVPTGFAVWTFVGAVQLVHMIAFHGEQRGTFIIRTNETRRRLKAVKDASNG